LLPLHPNPTTLKRAQPDPAQTLHFGDSFEIPAEVNPPKKRRIWRAKKEGAWESTGESWLTKQHEPRDVSKAMEENRLMLQKRSFEEKEQKARLEEEERVEGVERERLERARRQR
jgi:hypothetical protein